MLSMFWMEPNLMMNRLEVDFAQINQLRNLIDNDAGCRRWITILQREFIYSEGVVNNRTSF